MVDLRTLGRPAWVGVRTFEGYPVVVAERQNLQARTPAGYWRHFADSVVVPEPNPAPEGRGFVAARRPVRNLTGTKARGASTAPNADGVYLASTYCMAKAALREGGLTGGYGS